MLRYISNLLLVSIKINSRRKLLYQASWYFNDLKTTHIGELNDLVFHAFQYNNWINRSLIFKNGSVPLV